MVMLHGDGQYAPELLRRCSVHSSRTMRTSSSVRGCSIARTLWRAGCRVQVRREHRADLIENLLGGHLSDSIQATGATAPGSEPDSIVEGSDEWHFDSHILPGPPGGREDRRLPIPTHYGDEVCHVNRIVYGLNCISALLFTLHRMRLIHLAVTIGAGGVGRQPGDPWSSAR